MTAEDILQHDGHVVFRSVCQLLTMEGKVDSQVKCDMQSFKETTE